jgi:DNA-directed RNA polymerase subunit RPC12/RpoP
MSEFSFRCKKCGIELSADDSYVGLEVACPECDEQQVVVAPNQRDLEVVQDVGVDGVSEAVVAEDSSALVSSSDGDEAVEIESIVPTDTAPQALEHDGPNELLSLRQLREAMRSSPCISGEAREQIDSMKGKLVEVAADIDAWMRD